MSRLLCCLRARRRHDDMGAALSHVQEGDACDDAGLPAAPPTMADVIRERKKKAGSAGLGTLRRRIAAAARRPRDARPDRGCEHARFVRSVVSSWRLAEVFLLSEQLEAGAALRDLLVQAELAREPAASLPAALHRAYRDRWWCDVELVGAGWSLRAHRCVLAARCAALRRLLQRHPPPLYRVPLEGSCAGLSRADMHAVLRCLYAGGSQWEHGENYDGDLDIINVDQSNSLCRGSCRGTAGTAGSGSGALGAAGGLAQLLGFSADSLHRDMRYLLESGELADCRLSWAGGGAGGVAGGGGGGGGGAELPAHRLVLAARSRYFRSVMSRRGASSGTVCVDEKVLPRRMARALLHAAYTDQVDLSLIGRNSSSPSSTTSSNSSAWSGRGRAGSHATLEDAFQLYEIARFLEMPIAVQGCEDAVVEALTADTLPTVLRWASAPHASQWVYRQAMRFLRDEFPAVMWSASSARLPRSALAEALGSPFLQASEAQALRGLLRWAERHALRDQEPNVVWHTAHSVSRRRRRANNDGPLRETLAPLLPLVRVEHLPPDHELVTQLVRRGIMSPVSPPAGQTLADAWLGRSNRPARCFLPYLDELKALLQHQAPPEAELTRMRRARTTRIPDTLYMVSGAGRAGAGAGAGQGPGVGSAAGAGAGACVSPRLLHGLRARRRELRAAPAAARARRLHAHDAHPVHTQIALRVVREMSLPDACAELLLADSDDTDRDCEWESPSERLWEPDCCRRLSSSRCASTASLRSGTNEQDTSRTSSCRRELPSRASEGTQHSFSRQSLVGGVPLGGMSVGGPGPGAGAGAGAASGGRLSLCVPDVAMAPNANTHLLAAPYPRPPHREYSEGGGAVLQLDLGDGATHTPRPGSRAARALAAGRETGALRGEPGALRGYPFHPRAGSPGGGPLAGGPMGGGPLGGGPPGVRCRTLPPCRDLPPPLLHQRDHDTMSRGRAPASSLAVHLHQPLSRSGSGSGTHTNSSPSPSPRRIHHSHNYRLEPSYSSSGSGSRGQSPNNYA